MHLLLIREKPTTSRDKRFITLIILLLQDSIRKNYLNSETKANLNSNV